MQMLLGIIITNAIEPSYSKYFRGLHIRVTVNTVRQLFCRYPLVQKVVCKGHYEINIVNFMFYNSCH